VLTRGRGGIAEVFRGIAAARSYAGRSNFGLKKLFGWVERGLISEEGDYVELLREVLHSIAVERGEFTTATKEHWIKGDGGWLRTAELATQYRQSCTR
jgi:hypothetical protein